MIRFQFIPHTLKFSFAARTSRNTMREIETVLIQATNEETGDRGWGECIRLDGLSLDMGEDYLRPDPDLIASLSNLELEDSNSLLASISEIVPDNMRSMRIGMETALLDLLHGAERRVFPGSFVDEAEPIPINGLIWMGHSEFMLQQITERIYEGFDCIKMKIGGIDFDQECDILDYVRRKYFNRNITIRLDANGSLGGKNALNFLDRLSAFDIHSIEQPLQAGDPGMKDLIRNSPIPVALDEELIEPSGKSEKERLLDELKPAFIVLKPSLLGGFKNTSEWIDLAGERGIGWWITSALESNVGLNAIAQFTAMYNPQLPQGLGTGRLYTNNVPSPLTVKQGQLSYGGKEEWNFEFEDEQI